jgi:hypothetical protein
VIPRSFALLEFGRPPVCRVQLMASGQFFLQVRITHGLLEEVVMMALPAVGDGEQHDQWEAEMPPPSPRKRPTCTRPAKSCLADLQILHAGPAKIFDSERLSVPWLCAITEPTLRVGSIARVVQRTRSEGSRRCLTGTGGSVRHLETAAAQSLLHPATKWTRDGNGFNIPSFRPDRHKPEHAFPSIAATAAPEMAPIREHQTQQLRVTYGVKSLGRS